MPRTCHLCGTTLPSISSEGDREFLCTPCFATLPRTLYHNRKNNPMENRFAGIFPFERATGHFFYSSGSTVSELMQDLKYRHFKQLARYMGKIVGKELLTTGFLTGIDFIVPVPMHFLKKAIRGYNQTEEMALGMSKETGIPVNTSLYARRPHRTQTALSIENRRKNLQQVFNLPANHGLDGKHLLLLDDVCTTGTTLTTAAETIISNTSDAKISLIAVGVTF